MKKTTTKQLQDKLWKKCRELAFLMYEPHCYTCSARNLEGFNCQLGHMWAKASVSAHLKYDIRVLRWQCMRCNQFLGGMGAVYYARMLKEKGQKYMESLERERQILVKADVIFYQQKIDEIQKQIDEYEKT